MLYQNRLNQLQLEKQLADEKIHLSRELHDNIGSHLTFLISSIDTMSFSVKSSNLKDKLKNLSDYGRTTMRELRNTIWAMKQEGADLTKLILKLNELKRNIHENIQSVQMEIRNDLDDPVPLNATQMLNLYRIVQESVQNTLKYAGATHIDIHFKKTESGFNLKINDNGSGFYPDKVSSGNGIRHMRQRCEDAGGDFGISSSSEGTRIRCRIRTY